VLVWVQEVELEHEVGKLRSALETQQDAALERLNIKEQEWRGRLQQEQEKLATLTCSLEEASGREKQLQEKLEALSSNKKHTTDQLKQSLGKVKIQQISH